MAASIGFRRIESNIRKATLRPIKPNAKLPESGRTHEHNLSVDDRYGRAAVIYRLNAEPPLRVGHCPAKADLQTIRF